MNPVIENYESLSALMENMREAAAQGEWDRLIELEKQCSQRVQAMKVADATTPLSETLRKRKVELIHKILADDAAIRSFTQPWMAQLQRILHSAKIEKNVRMAYSGGQF